MTDSDGAQPSRGLLSWIRKIFRTIWPHRPPIRPERDVSRERLRIQVEVIRRAFGDEVAVAKGGSEDDADAEFLYRPEHVLVRSGEDRELIEIYFRDRQEVYEGFGNVSEEIQTVDGLDVYQLPRRRSDGAVEVLEILQDLDREVREGIATPDHVLYVTPGGAGHLCPATEPDLPPSNRPVPARSQDSSAGANVRVSVVDTGWYAGAATDSDSPWLATDVEGEDDPGITSSGVIEAYAGHGTFVTGVLRCIAPKVEVEVEAIMVKGGAAFEAEIVKQLNQALTHKDKPDLISISAGTHTYKGAPLMSFVALSAIYKFAENDEAPLVVAAAGNDSSDAEFWPAAFPWVVAVGSVDADGKKSKFSNYGKWVDVWAQGSNLVNAFPTGRYTTYEPQTPAGEVRDFTGMATWSGTSFATPIVTGAIAAYKTQHQKSSVRAAYAEMVTAAKAKATATPDPTYGAMTKIGPPFM